MIVVEGADNSGKTTMAKALGLPYFSVGPAPKTVGELIDCLRDQEDRARTVCVQDRLTCISQQVYSDHPEASLLQERLKIILTYPGIVLVYCRPPERRLMDLSTHKVQSYDTEEHMKKIADHQHQYIERYDAIMAAVPHVLYDYTDPDVSLGYMVETLIKSQHDPVSWQRLRTQISMTVGA